MYNRRRAVGIAFSCLIAMLGIVAGAPGAAHAAGRVYAHRFVAQCRALARVHGVYAVWDETGDYGRALRFEIVLAPGIAASSVEPAIRDAFRTPIGGFAKVEVLLWSYHDPLSGPSFSGVMANLFPGPLGFPDYRGVKLAAVAIGPAAARSPDAGP